MTNRRPVFDYRTRVSQFDEAMLANVRTELDNFRNSIVPRENSMRFDHGRGWRTKPVEFADSDGEFETHSVETSIRFEDVRQHNLSILTDFKRSLVENMSRQFMTSIFGAVNKATEKTGNVVSAPDYPSLADAFLDTIKKIEFGVDRHGQVSMPEFHGGPEATKKMLESLDAKGPEFREELERIKTEKIEQALEREQVRLSKFPPSEP